MKSQEDYSESGDGFHPLASTEGDDGEKAQHGVGLFCAGQVGAISLVPNSTNNVLLSNNANNFTF